MTLLALSWPAAALGDPAGEDCESAAGSAADRLQCYERRLCVEGAAAQYREACLEAVALHLLSMGPATTPVQAAPAPRDAPPRAAPARAAAAAEPAPDWARDDTQTNARERTEPEQIESVVIALEPIGSDRHRMLLANQEVWQEYQARRTPLDVGDTVVIHPGTLGSFRMAGPNGLLTGVRRVDCSDEQQRPRCRSLWQRATTR